MAHPTRPTAASLAWTLFRASHPEPVVAMTGAAALLAAASGKGARRAVLATAAVLAGQLFTGWTNDVLDAGLDRRAGRLDKPIATGELKRSTAQAALAGALPAALVLSAAVGRRELRAHSAGIAAAAAYNLGLRATPLSFVPYALAFPLIPVFGMGEAPPVWVLAAAALVGTAAHLGQVLPDIERDRRDGVLGLPQRLGTNRSALLAAGLLTAAAATLAAAARRPATTAAAAASVVASATAARLAERGRPGAAFRAVMLSAGLISLGYAVSRTDREALLVDETDQRDLAGPDRPVIDHAPADEVHLGDDPGTV